VSEFISKPEVISALLLFAPDFDYKRSPFLGDFTDEELVFIKESAANIIAQESDRPLNDRIKVFTQITSVYRLEIPSMFAKRYGLDAETAMCFGQSLIDRICFATTNFAPSWGGELEKFMDALPANRALLLYKTPFLFALNEILVEGATRVFTEANEATDTVYDLLTAVELGYTRLALAVVKELTDDDEDTDFFITPEIGAFCRTVGTLHKQVI